MAYSVTYPSTVILALKDLINCSCCCHCAALTKVKRRPEVGLNMSCGCHLFLFIFPLSLSLHLCQRGWNASGELSHSLFIQRLIAICCEEIGLVLVDGYMFWLVFSMRWTVGEMDSRLRTIWLEPFDGHTVHKTLHLHTAGMTLKKSVLQSRANVSPKMKNRAFAVNDTSVWNNAAYFPGFFSLWI